MQAIFELYEDKSGTYRFRFFSDSGEKLLTSKRYKDRRDAATGIDLVRASAQLDRRYQRKLSDDGNDYFNIEDATQEVIASSRSFASKSAMVRSIACFKKLVGEAGIKDKTECTLNEGRVGAES